MATGSMPALLGSSIGVDCVMVIEVEVVLPLPVLAVAEAVAAISWEVLKLFIALALTVMAVVTVYENGGCGGGFGGGEGGGGEGGGEAGGPSPVGLPLAAIDLAFSTGLDEAAVLELVHSRPALLRCNLRAASGVSAEAYNEVGGLMQARKLEPDVVENRRRPRHLAPREAPPFFYLKRQRES